MKSFFRFLTLFISFNAFAQDSPGAFENCLPGVNDYLESLIPNLPETSNSNLSAFPSQCVLGAMVRRIPPTGTTVYGTCEDLKQKDARTTRLTCQGEGCELPRPCLSKRYFQMVYQSYVTAMQCLGINPKELFPLISLESGFKTNIGNLNGEWGIGQLGASPEGISNWKNEIRALRAKPECKALDETLANFTFRKLTSCERISIPGNPDREILALGLLYLSGKKHAREQIEKHQKRRSSPLSGTETESLAIFLARTSYKGGEARVAAAFSSYSEQPETLTLNGLKLQEGFKRYLKLHYGEGTDFERMRNVVALYADSVESSGPECTLHPIEISSK